FFKGWSDYFVDGWFESNRTKKYSAYAEMLFAQRSLYKSRRYQFTFNQTFRFSNKFSVRHGLSNEPQTNNVGFAATDSLDNIIFGRRSRHTIENFIEFKYNF